MAGALSGRLVNSYQPNSPFNSSVVTHESMSFNPTMHGSPFAQQSFSLFGSQPNDSISEETARKIASLQAKLNQKLGPEFISQRPGPGGGPKLTYAEGWKVINLANEVFGFNGWSSSIVSLTTDFADFIEASGKYNVGVTAIVRITLRDGTYHEDVGYGLLDNGRQKGAALDKSKKEAVTDGIKRALRNFGNVLGNCLYDKSYTSEVVKMKVPPAKFKKEELHRLPEFNEVSVSASTSSNTSAIPIYPNQHQANLVTPTRQPIQQNQTKPLSSIPAHVRSEISSSGSTSISGTGNAMHADVKGKGPAHAIGLNTPITTPHPPPQHPNLNPPQYQRQTDRKVTFAGHQHPLQASTTSAATVTSIKPEPKPSTRDSDVDEFFGFNSDDDAFFALADLGPPIDVDGTDVGRPIDSDEGRPINPDEGGAETTINEDDEFGQHQHQTTSVVGVVSVPKISRQEMIAAALLSTESKVSNSSGSVQGHGTADERQASGSASRSGNLSGLNPTISGNGTSMLKANGVTDTIPVIWSSMPQQQQQNQNQNSSLNLTSLAQQRHQRHMAQRQNQNQNLNQTGSSSNGNELKRQMSSIGGFHFPPGVKPLEQQVNLPISTSSSSSGIGFKRAAEAMASDGTPIYRTSSGRPSIGMGLQQSASGSGVSTGNREILGRLEVGEGGDVKRMRR